ncbi:MAG TPA: FtsX-like permease family protein [Ohtaekwangia sp.]|uniref:FtsX-like permease family protein n=1 Tax=Ohtaekwangia sp. TaxID=2066019 RepID=UPI002F9354AE
MKKQPVSPPVYILRFFRWFCNPNIVRYIEGDLLELYHERLQRVGKRRADLLIAIDVLLLFRPGIIRKAGNVQWINNHAMFKNYLKVGFRNILKYKVFSGINVFGLAIAMSVCMLIILMLADQKRYDAFHEKKDRIYRILSTYSTARQPYATSPYPLAATLKADYPVMEDAVNLTPGVGGDGSYQQRLADMRGYFTDPSFFRVFSFELLKGDKVTALKEPNSMVITTDIAEKLFGNEEPLGKTIEFADRQLPFPQRIGDAGSAADPWGSFTITGVIDAHRYKSHLQFDVLVSASSRLALYAEKKLEDRSDNWQSYYQTYTFALLREGKNTSDLTTALSDLVKRKYTTFTSEETKDFRLLAQNLADVQLDLKGNDTNNRMPRIGYYFLSVLAIVIMFSACLNYTNLSIARALTRAREIGVRKVTGASRRSLVLQFLSESVLTAMFALAMALVLLVAIKPAFKSLWVNKYLEFELPSSFSVYAVFTGFALLIGIISGVYPAFRLSSFQPVRVLKKLDVSGTGKLGMRKVLSVTQFVISLFFITTAILIFNQFNHFLKFDYGFDTKGIVNIPLQGIDHEKLSHAFGNVPGVATISACDIIPAAGQSNGIQFKRAGSTQEYMRGGVLRADENFIGNLGLHILAGKNIPSVASDRFVVVNEQMVRTLGYKFPSQIIGETFETNWDDGILEVVGVVEDFRYRLLINEDKIEPMFLRNQPGQFAHLNVRIASANPAAVIASLEEEWKKIDPVHPFRYDYFDDQLTSTHQGIWDAVSIIGFIAFLAIVIACLGLLGMAMYTAERRKKEVGIRKVLGAEDLRIAILLSKEFLKVLFISICIGAPLSYIINNSWLQKFPNRVDFGVGTVLLGVSVLLLLGLFTISSQTIRASRSNPVEALKVE